MEEMVKGVKINSNNNNDNDNGYFMIIYSALITLQTFTCLIHTVIITSRNFNLHLVDIRDRIPVVVPQINQIKETFF